MRGWGFTDEMFKVKCELLAINVSLRERWCYSAPILPGKFFHSVLLSVLEWMHWFPIIMLRKYNHTGPQSMVVEGV